MRAGELRPGREEKPNKEGCTVHTTGPFSLWGTTYVNGVQATGVERAGQVEERAEGTRRGTRDQVTEPLDCSSASSVPLWKWPSTKLFTFPSVYLKTIVPSVSSPGLNIVAAWGWGCLKTQASVLPSFWNHWEKTFFSPASSDFS